ncbi:MAG: diguanylate cyclase [Spirochaetales bacterium]|nr:diguanylate cyclase [Spirochaetales bacterium]
MNKLQRLIVFLFFASAFLYADSAIILDNIGTTYFPGFHLRYLSDEVGTLDIADIITLDKQGDLTPSNEKKPSFGRVAGAYWTAFTIGNPHNKEQTMILENDYGHIDHIQYYVYRSENIVAEGTGGDYYPLQNNSMKYHNFVRELSLPPHSETTVYMRFESTGNLLISLNLLTPIALAEKINREQWFLGLYFGIMGAMALYNFFLFIFLRDRNYLFYVLYLTSFVLALMGANRLDTMYLWPNSPLMANLEQPIFYNLTFLFGGLFCRSFLNTKKNCLPIIDKLILLLVAGSALGLILSITSGYVAGMYSVWYFSATLGPVFLLSAGINAWIKKLKIARYYTLAWTIFLLSAVLFNFRNLGILGNIPLLEFIPHIGSTLEVFLLSLALSDRINTIKNEKMEAERKYSTQLETKVEERTEALIKANRELEEISKTDGLTGLYNRRFFDANLSDHWKHHTRSRHQISLLMCDIDYFKQYNDSYGHQAGDDCLRDVAEALQKSVSRPHDFVARYGGEEFTIILPDTDSEGALEVGKRITQAIEDLEIPHEYSSAASNLTLSIGIATMVPDRNQKQSDLLKLADMALYKSKHDGRNLISTLH